MNISIGSDHAGFAYKEAIKLHLEKAGHQVIDCGTFTKASCDYPDYAHAVAASVEKGETEKGVLDLWVCQWRLHHSEQACRHPCRRFAGRRRSLHSRVPTTMPMWFVFLPVLFLWNPPMRSPIFSCPLPLKGVGMPIASTKFKTKTPS